MRAQTPSPKSVPFGTTTAARSLLAASSQEEGWDRFALWPRARARIGSIARSLVAADSTASIEFSGVTGYQYDVQRANSFSPPITWTTVTTSPLSPAADGSFTFTDAKAPAGMGYYRSVGR